MSLAITRRTGSLQANINVRNTKKALRELYPNNDIPNPEWMEIREFHLPHLRHLA